MIEKEKLLEVSKKIRKCQRGWELDKSIPMEHIELLSEIAKHSPSKQDEAYFDVYVITQRSLIEKYYKEIGKKIKDLTFYYVGKQGELFDDRKKNVRKFDY